MRDSLKVKRMRGHRGTPCHGNEIAARRVFTKINEQILENIANRKRVPFDDRITNQRENVDLKNGHWTTGGTPRCRAATVTHRFPRVLRGIVINFQENYRGAFAK